VGHPREPGELATHEVLVGVGVEQLQGTRLLLSKILD
jgi:hypothetical protein